MKNLLGFLKQYRDELNKEGLYLHKDHPIPRTRREFLASGVYSGALTVALPSLATFLLRVETAHGADLSCSTPSGLLGCPVAQFNFSGGRNLWGHGLALGMNKHGDPANYVSANNTFKTNDFINYGGAPQMHPSTSGNEYVTLGGHPMQQHSYIYQSARDVFGARLADLEKRMQIISFCHRSADDSRDTEQNFLSMVRRLRGAGDFSIISNISGTERSGLSALPAFGVTEVSSVVSGRINDLVDTGLESLPADVRKKYFAELQNYMQLKITNQESYRIFGCSISSAAKKIEKFSEEIDPRAELPTLNEVFANDANGDRLASIIYLLETEQAVCSGIDGGGYDYHDGTSQGYEKDRTVFQNSVWPIVDYYLRANKPIILYFTSDGATYCDGTLDSRDIDINGAPVTASLGVNTGDRGRNGGSMMIVLSGDDSKKPQTIHNQVGFGLPGGGIARAGNPIGYDQNNATSIVFETMRRAMNLISPKPTTATYQEATNGNRFDENLLGPYLPLDKA